MKSIRIALATAAIALAVATTACSPGGTGTADPTPAQTTPTATATPTPTPTMVTATCETTVTADTLTSFEDAGWTAGKIETAWAVGGVPVEGGISCRWGDYSTANDNVSWLAWGPLDDAAAQAAIAGLLSEGGWRHENGDAGAYVTVADANMYPVTDADGYATTYLFADGQVKAATTRSGLAAITAPEGFQP